MLPQVLAYLVSLIACTTAKYHGKLFSRNINSITAIETTSSNNQLLDLNDFQFVSKPDSSQLCTEKLYLLALIHSKPENFKERELIRQTWGSVGTFNGMDVKIVFLMGQYSQPVPRSLKWHKHKSHKTSDNENSIKSRSLNRNGFFKSNKFESDRYKTEAVDSLVKLESSLHNDIIQGNFDDVSRNLTYKHVMGYKWVTEECHHQPTFVLKADDNVFVEMYHLMNFLTAVYGNHPDPSIVCDVIPAGTAPHKPEQSEILKQMKSSKEDLYPKYCSGAAYLITPSLIPSFLKATRDVPPIPLDDIYMMGMVREYLGISPFYLNLRYTYELSRPYKWLKRKNFQPLPFLFVVSDSKDKRNWSEAVKKLWEKSKRIQEQQFI